jgi:hypothetical protein
VLSRGRIFVEPDGDSTLLKPDGKKDFVWISLNLVASIEQNKGVD